VPLEQSTPPNRPTQTSLLQTPQTNNNSNSKDEQTLRPTCRRAGRHEHPLPPLAQVLWRQHRRRVCPQLHAGGLRAQGGAAAEGDSRGGGLAEHLAVVFRQGGVFGVVDDAFGAVLLGGGGRVRGGSGGGGRGVVAFGGVRGLACGCKRRPMVYQHPPLLR